MSKNHPRRQQEGVYGSETFGPPGQQVKVFLLDTRYHRDPPSATGDVLGEAQWRWLESELRRSKAQVNLLVSSIQMVPSDHRFEKWADFPEAKARLFKLLAEDGIPPVTVLSGDRHLAEISVEKAELPYPLHDITSSSLNLPLGPRDDEVNTRRIGKNFTGANFGTLEIDWTFQPPVLTFSIRDGTGTPVRSAKVVQQR